MPAGILLLVVILTIWNPVSLALQAASALSSIGSRSGLSLAFLVARLIMTSIGLAAGVSLWLRRPGAVTLAKTALVLLAAEAVVRLATRVDLDGVPPGTRRPLAVFLILHNTAWYAYLQRSRRVRAFYRLESHSRNGDIRL